MAPNYRGRPVIGTAATDEIRSLLNSLYRQYRNDEVYGIGEAALKLQLSTWKKLEQETRAADDAKELFGLDFIKALGENIGRQAREDVGAIKKLSEEKSIKANDVQKLWTWKRLPYSVRQAGLADDATSAPTSEPSEEDGSRAKKRSKVEGEEELIADVDEWILQNETYLRFVSRRALLKCPDVRPWSFGLVAIDQLSLVLLQPHESSSTHVSITRPTSLTGFTVLGDKRKSTILVQPSQAAFNQSWDKLTDNVLKGLDWNNVFVAGGLVLGTVLTPEVADKAAHKKEEWIASDIDLYIYGLGVEQANDKIRHIADVYKRNLPAGSPFLVVRNSQTITLYSAWPRKRVQIVLKLVQSPREVLLNFDLDICAVGFDGTTTWMLPRFVRALETGYTVFTMDIINGHYLGDRKASRDPRVFKYANKGYGIRILPSYIASLATYSNATQTQQIARGQPLFSAPLSLKDLADGARKWTSQCIKHFLKVGHTTKPSYWPPRQYPAIKSKLPVFSHAMLESYKQRSSEPLGKSCLTGFSLFMRHVALWEEEVKGKIAIHQELYAENTYGEGQANLAYDDTPEYKWDEDFNIAHFCRHIDHFNSKDSTSFEEIIGYVDFDKKVRKPTVTRLTYGSSVDEVLSPDKDLHIMFILSEKLAQSANGIVVEALKDAGINDHNGALKILHAEPENTKDALVSWDLDKILNWQMLDRRIDEVRELMWAYHRAGEHMQCEDRILHVMTQISKRAIRVSVEEELEAFVIWVGRKPYYKSSIINGHFMADAYAGGTGMEGVQVAYEDVRSDEDDDEDEDED